MIRYMTIEQLDEVIDIWYEGNVETHTDVDQSYWLDNKDMVKEAMSNANIYVSMDGDKIAGFIGIAEGYYIAGVFVRNHYQGKGVGKSLLDFVKDKYDELALDVYKTNERALAFYKREGFVVVEESVDEATDLIECSMVWPETL